MLLLRHLHSVLGTGRGSRSYHRPILPSHLVAAHGPVRVYAEAPSPGEPCTTDIHRAWHGHAAGMGVEEIFKLATLGALYVYIDVRGGANADGAVGQPPVGHAAHREADFVGAEVRHIIHLLGHYWL